MTPSSDKIRRANLYGVEPGCPSTLQTMGTKTLTATTVTEQVAACYHCAANYPLNYNNKTAVKSGAAPQAL